VLVKFCFLRKDVYLNKPQYVGYFANLVWWIFSRTLKTQYLLQKKGKGTCMQRRMMSARQERECEGIVSLMVGSAILCKDSRSWRCANAYWTRYCSCSPVSLLFSSEHNLLGKKMVSSTFTINEYGFDLLAHFLSFSFS
jgi:hypothetical protein